MKSEITPEDQALLTALHETTDPQQFAAALWGYYHDADRAARTSRDLLYLHLGMACGVIQRMASEGTRP